jgi:hypothetical protein
MHLTAWQEAGLVADMLTYKSSPVTVVDGEVQKQNGDFCEQIDKGGPGSRQGFCEGQPDEHGAGNSFIGGRWYFTINGQVFPTIRVSSPEGEIWRITNASAQVAFAGLSREGEVSSSGWDNTRRNDGMADAFWGSSSAGTPLSEIRWVSQCQ